MMMLPFVLLTHDFIYGRASDDWPTTQGTVIYSRLEWSQHGDDPPTLVAKVKYEYIVNGIQYQSSHISYLNNDMSPSETVKEFNRGSRVTVHYNPDNPGQAVLITGYNTGMSIFGFVCGAIGISILILTYYKPSRKPPYLSKRNSSRRRYSNNGKIHVVGNTPAMAELLRNHRSQDPSYPPSTEFERLEPMEMAKEASFESIRIICPFCYYESERVVEDPTKVLLCDGCGGLYQLESESN